MTAPDPGLTDLIAAHREVMRWNDFAYPPLSTTPYRATSVTEMVNCSCGESMTVDSFPAHVALVVEQHTNGRIAELEARIAEAQSLCHDTGRYNAARQKHWNIRVFACDVLAALKGRAALEGEQQ